jgi:diguanylate cyclase (GGDEF)-like protein
MNKKNHERQIVRRQLYESLSPDRLNLKCIAALAGDLELSDDEQANCRRLISMHGDRYFAEMLFVLTHQYFAEESARHLWHKIVSHKCSMEKFLGRAVGISVAAMDYLANVEKRIENPSVISKNKIATIAEIALKDGLTRLFDVSTFHTKFKTEIKRYHRYKSEVSLILIDIDNFKQINDRYGHRRGDQVLRALSTLIRKTARDLDICARYGGEEFALVLPQTGPREALQLAERLRRRVEKQFRKDYRVTISAGVATCPLNAKSASALIEKADQALYRSKREGKNRTTVWPA